MIYVMTRDMYMHLRDELKTTSRKAIITYINNSFGLRGKITQIKFCRRGN